MIVGHALSQYSVPLLCFGRQLAECEKIRFPEEFFETLQISIVTSRNCAIHRNLKTWRVLVKRKGNGSKTRLRTYVDSGTDAIANECAELKI